MCCFRASLHSLSGCMKHNHKTYPWILGLQSSFDFGLPAVHRHRAGMLLIMNLLILPAPPSHWWSVLLFSLTPPPYLVVWLAPAKNHPGCLKTSSKLRHLDSQQIQQSPSYLFENWNHLAHHLPTLQLFIQWFTQQSIQTQACVGTPSSLTCTKAAPRSSLMSSSSCLCVFRGI